MPECIVDVLETVEVHHQDGQDTVLPFGPGKGHLQAVGEQFPVGQSGQGIVVGHFPDGFLVPLAVRRVPGHPPETRRIPLAIPDQGGRHLQRP